jgi:hypothetical protein
MSAPLPLHPMSKEIKSSDGEISISERAFFKEACIAKFPHPGHQVGIFVEL